MQTQQVVFFKGVAGTKVKPPGAGKNESRKALQTPTWRDFATSNISVQVPCLVPNSYTGRM
jgi:hypothetical protein